MKTTGANKAAATKKRASAWWRMPVQSLVAVMFYSYRMASIGSNCAAFLAGYQPKNTPVNVHTAKLMMNVDAAGDHAVEIRLKIASR
ncbi:hypothetical protein SAMN04487825_1077 [Prevotella sp. kh1p2]|nr:hypothetical protein SAMN04487825_1077 [Prevotella sp. kh1p2]SNU12523.1 hypothetical protein SAMN06298210_1306 [Prevotellaceae bacterium KH2P17]